MARAIPTYQRQSLATGIQSAPNASSNVSASDPVASALGNLGQAIGGVTNTLVDEQIQAAAETRRTVENAAAVDVSNVLSQGDVYWQENATKRMQAWKVGDPDMRQGIGADFDKWASESAAKLPTEASRKYFQQHVAGMKARLQTNAFSFQEKSLTSKLNADSDAGQQADENVVYNDPARFDEIYKRRVEPLLARTDLSEGEKIKAADVYKRKLSLAVERGEMQRDPVGWYAKRFGSTVPQTGAQSAGGAVAGPTIQTAAGDVPSALWAAQIKQESGGQQFKDGKPLTSSAGAIGIAQVMPGTAREAARLAGLPYDERRYQQDAGYNEKLGQAYMAQQLKTFGGDQAKALAAYNMGPGSAEKGNGVAGLVAKHGENWLSFAPAETQNYVKTIMAKAGQAPAAPASAGQPAAVVSRSVLLETAPVSFKGMDWEQQDALRSMAETRIKQDSAQFKAQVDGILRDAVAMHKDGIQDPQQIPVETFERAYGAEAPRMFAEYQKSRLMGADIGAFKTQSEAEIMGTLERSQPVPGPAYAADDERQRMRVQAAQSVLKARADDPAGYATRNSENLKGQQAALAVPTLSAEERATLTQRFTRDNLAEQQRLGIASPQVLTPRQADAIAMRAMKATKPEDSANLIAGLETEYGEFFPRVFDQLVKDGKISGDLLIIPNLPSQTAREAVSRLARVKEADLVQGIDAASQKAVKEAVVATMTDFARTIPLMTESAAKTVNAYETTLRKLAYQFMQAGTKPGEAAEQARTMLLGQYTFEGSTRIPKTVDASKALTGAGRMLKNDLTGIDVPRDGTGARSGPEAAAEWQATVRARPEWYTRQDDSGVELWAMGNNGTRYRVTRGGQGVAYTWEQLTAPVAAAQKAKDATARDFGAAARFNR